VLIWYDAPSAAGDDVGITCDGLFCGDEGLARENRRVRTRDSHGGSYFVVLHPFGLKAGEVHLSCGRLGRDHTRYDDGPGGDEGAC
jgi:hypothetical protein